MYLNYDDTSWIIDTETDSLDPTKIWCLCYENAITDEKGVIYDYQGMSDFVAGKVLIGHNIVKADAPWLNRLAGSRVVVGSLRDTLVYSQLYSPSLIGGHSLDAWGERLGYPKDHFNDFSRCSPELVARCHQDVTITKQLFIRVVAALKKIGFSEGTIETQHRMTAILHRQKKNGFFFNEEQSVQLYTHLRQEEHRYEDLIRQAFPDELLPTRTYKQAFRKDGQPTKLYESLLESLPRVEVHPDGTYTGYQFVPFNLGSPIQRVGKLLELGWGPDQFTETKSERWPEGFPQLTEKSLKAFAEKSGVSEVALFHRWLSLNGRANMVRNWQDNYNPDTGCIHGDLFPANTLRFRHSNPNSANIPAVRVNKDTGEILFGEAGDYTYEARDCWQTRDPHKRQLVGTDASGLELRMLAEHLHNPEFTEQVVNGDPHIYNMKKAGLDSKANAKTFIYAFMYGAQDKKLGSITGGTKEDGRILRERFLGDFDGFANLMEEVSSEFRRGRIRLVDGAWVICPSKHAALNYKLQGSGARVMAKASVLFEGHVRRSGLDSLKVGDIQDEWQYDVLLSDSREHSRLSVLALEEAGRELNLAVPITGVAKAGRTWAETH